MSKNKPHYFYHVFDLTIGCDFELPMHFCLKPVETLDPDVFISSGSVDHILADYSFKNNYLQFNDSTFLLTIKNIGRFLINNGCEIIYDANTNASMDDISTYLLGTCLSTILYQRNIIAFHGSAVLCPKGAVIFTGQQGAGKSTTATALAQNGWPLFSDDVCAIQISDIPYISKGITRAKLNADSYKTITGELPTSTPISKNIPKYAISYGEDTNLKSLPIYAICIIEPMNNSDDTSVQIQPLSKSESIKFIGDNIYRPLIHNILTPPDIRFLQLANLTKNTQVFRIRRKVGFADFESYISLIESMILRK